LLIEHGADVDARENVFGDTPLHVATAFGHAEVVRVLLSY
jgi:ankyrin repeat protein